MTVSHAPGAFTTVLPTQRNVVKKEQPQTKGFKKYMNKALGKEVEPPPASIAVDTQAQNNNIQSTGMQRQHSMPAAQPAQPSKPREAKVGDKVAHLNKEKEGIERQWSKDTAGVSNESHQAITHAVSRKAINAAEDPQVFHNALELGPQEAASFLANGSLQTQRAPHPAWTSEPQSIGDHGSFAPRPNGYPPSPRQHEQALRRPSNVIRSQSHEMLKGELELAKQQIGYLERELDVARQEAMREQLFDEEHNALRNAHDTLLAAQHRASAEARKLEEANLKLQEDVKTWRTNWNALNHDFTQLQTDLTSVRKVDDKWFATQWKDLHIKIELLSLQYFQGRLAKSSASVMDRVKGSRLEKFDDESARCLARLTGPFSRYLKSDNERPLIIQAYIWSILVNNAFDHVGCYDGGFLWAGQSRAALCYLNRDSKPVRKRRHKDGLPLTPSESQRIEKDTRTFHKWRAETAIMMLEREPVKNRIKNIGSDITSLVTEMFATSAPYIVTTKDRPLNAAELDIKEQLRAILIEAIEIDAEMAQQRARIFCEQWRGSLDGEPSWGFQWVGDEAEMICTAEQNKNGIPNYRNPCVEMIIQPALSKEGNQYGEGYEKREILCKAKVIVGEDPTLPGSRHI
jgi:hypothetical protein